MAVSENASVVENTSIIESKRGYKNEKKCGKTAIIENGWCSRDHFGST